MDFKKNKYYKAQVSFIEKVVGKGSKSKTHPKRFSLDDNLEGFIGKKQKFEQHNKLITQLKQDDKGNGKFILELPPYCGKTTAAFLASMFKTYHEAGNSLIIYPSKKLAKSAYIYATNKLKKLHFISDRDNQVTEKGFPLIQLIDNKQMPEYKDFLQPKIYITDIFTLHKYILMNLKTDFFWKLINFIVVEDFDKYNNIFGLNSAYVFRRLFTKISAYKKSAEEENRYFAVMGTTVPMENQNDFFGNLTSFTISDANNIITVNSKDTKGHNFLHWFLPLQRTEETNQFQKSDYYDEIQKLISIFLDEDSGSKKQNNVKDSGDKQQNNIALLWQNSRITISELSNIRANFQEFENRNVFIGHNLESLRLELLRYSLDWDKVDTIIIVGAIKPITDYKIDFNYLGQEQSNIILFQPHNPSLNYQVIDIIKKEPDDDIGILGDRPTKQFISIHGDNYEKLGSEHYDYMKKETPNIDSGLLKKYFSEQFMENNFNSENISSGWIYLALDVNRLPYPKRNDYDLLISHQPQEEFDLACQGEKIGSISIDKVDVYCYPNSKLFYNDKRYQVNKSNRRKRKIQVQRLDKEIFTTKIAEYDIKETRELLNEFNCFNNRIQIRSFSSCVDETILATKYTENFIDIHEDNLSKSKKGFQNKKLNIIELDLINLFNEQESAFNIIHSLAHLILEAVKTMIPLNVDEIVFNIDVEKNEEDEENYNNCKLQIIDITGNNDGLWQILTTQSYYNKIFEICWEILHECPCNSGCNSCLKVNYCNIPNCSNQIDKMSTYRLLNEILEKNADKYDRNKRLVANVKPKETGVIQSEIEIMHRMESFAFELLGKRFQIGIRPGLRYKSNFYTDDQIESGVPQGITFYDQKEIYYYPGLPEFVLYVLIFHERFHNYQKSQGGLAQKWTYFNWDDIEDNNNIPFAGKLLLEGSAVWFSIKAMEIFCDPTMKDFISSWNRNVYKSGLMLMFELEKRCGFTKTLKLLFEGKSKINIFEDRNLYNSYNTPIQLRIDSYLEESDYRRLICRQEQFNTNRLSVVLLYINKKKVLDRRISKLARSVVERIRVLKKELRMKKDTQSKFDNYINEILENLKPKVIWKDFVDLAQTLAHDEEILRQIEDRGRSDEEDRLRLQKEASNFSTLLEENEKIIDVFNKMKLLDVANDDLSLFCDGCETNCNLYTTCLINGGEKYLKEICNAYFNKKYNPSEQNLDFFPSQNNKEGIEKKVNKKRTNIIKKIIKKIFRSKNV